MKVLGPGPLPLSVHYWPSFSSQALGWCSAMVAVGAVLLLGAESPRGTEGPGAATILAAGFV